MCMCMCTCMCMCMCRCMCAHVCVCIYVDIHPSELNFRPQIYRTSENKLRKPTKAPKPPYQGPINPNIKPFL